MMNKEEIETALKNLGTIQDVSEYIMEEYKNQIPYSYLLFENKYNDSTDDSLCIEVNSDGTYNVTNDDLPYGCDKKEEVAELKNIFENTSFVIELTERDQSEYHAIFAVSAQATTLEQVIELVNEYRNYNDFFLKDKVKQITGDDGKIYFDRED